MSLLFWKRAEPSDTDESHEPAKAVDEQHPLPTGLYWTHAEGTSYEEVSPAHPLPVKHEGLTSVVGSLFEITPITVPGVVAAVA